MPDGATKLDHLKKVSGRVTVPELDYNDADEEAKYLLSHFYSVKSAAGVKIAYTELKHYSELMALNLEPFECEVIMGIDRIYEASVHG